LQVILVFTLLTTCLQLKGGMICTNDDKFYQICRALRSHGMMREMTDDNMKQEIIKANPDLNPDFIFIGPAHNFRSTELML
jgi:CDP-4-dehydro-6-deoxyglucose reductase, E1